VHPAVTGRSAEQADEFFAGRAKARAVFDHVRTILSELGPVEVRITRSQVAFRRRRGFAYLWMPGRYLRKPAAEVVLSIALGHEQRSPRFKQVVHPSPRIWMHHLEIHRPGDVDEQVRGWLREAADAAA
jgi:hypothetical protein